MDRIQSLIHKLKEQYDQQADPNLMLGTLQLLQFELSKIRSDVRQVLGTAKVAVTLPGITQPAAGFTPPAGYERFAPKPAGSPVPVKEKKETLLVEEGSVSVVQKNGQLDMVFDPMTEIPTLSHQPKELNEVTEQSSSLNDRLKETKTELVERLKETPVKDLRKAIGINDRFVFINDLFQGDESTYERSIKTINSFNIYAEAEYWINRELKVKLGWRHDHPSVMQFDQLVKRRFS